MRSRASCIPMLAAAVPVMLCAAPAPAQVASPQRLLPLRVAVDATDSAQADRLTDGMLLTIEEGEFGIENLPLPSDYPELLAQDLQCRTADDTCLARIGASLGATHVLFVHLRGSRARDAGEVRLVSVADPSAPLVEPVIGGPGQQGPAMARAVQAVMTRFASLRPGIGRISIRTRPSGASVVLEGSTLPKPVPLGSAPVSVVAPAGDYSIRLSRPGSADQTVQRTVVSGRSSHPLIVALEAAPVPPPVDTLQPQIKPVKPVDRNIVGKPIPPPPAEAHVPWKWISLGSGAGLAAIGAVLAGLAYMDRDQVRNAPRDYSVPHGVSGVTRERAIDLTARANREQDAAIGLWAVGGAAVVTGVVLWILEPRKSTASPAPRVTVNPVPGGMFVGAGGSF